MSAKAFFVALVLCVAFSMSYEPGAALANSHEGNPVFRAQIHLITGDVRDAGTDDSVSVSLGRGNLTWVDYGRDDFERGDAFTYDLLIDGIDRIRDITSLTLSKTGTNGWCVRALILSINGLQIFQHVFQRGSTQCLWLDNSGGHSTSVTIPGSEMRSSDMWQRYRQSVPTMSFTRGGIESRIEALVGHQMTATGKKLKWGKYHGRAVEASRKDAATLHVDLDLKYPIPYWPDAEVDVDFDLIFSCHAGLFNVAVRNLKVVADSAWYTEILSLGFGDLIIDNLITDGLGKALNKQLGWFMQSLNRSSPSPTCLRISVMSNGDVVFAL